MIVKIWIGNPRQGVRTYIHKELKVFLENNPITRKPSSAHCRFCDAVYSVQYFKTC